MSTHNDLERIKRKYEIIDDYFQRHGLASKIFLEMSRTMVEDIYGARKLRAMYQLEREFDDWVRNLPREEHRLALLELLQKEIGEDFAAKENRRVKRVQKILDRGEILSDAEYRLLLERVEEIYADRDMSATVEAINKLLATYDK